MKTDSQQIQAYLITGEDQHQVYLYKLKTSKINPTGSISIAHVLAFFYKNQ